MEKKNITRNVGGITFVFECQDDLDTRVSIGGITLCWITYSDIDNFVKELQNVIDNHRI